MSKNEVRLRLSLGVEYEKKTSEDKYTCIRSMLDNSLLTKGDKETLLGELRRIEKELGWPHRRYNSKEFSNGKI